MWHSFRKNILLLITLTFYVMALVGVVYAMERFLLTIEKRDYVFRSGEIPILQLDRDQQMLDAISGRILLSDDPKKIEEGRRMMLSKMKEIVDGPGPVFSMRLLDKDGRVIASAERPDKLWRQRKWGNTVILNFYHGFARVLQHPQTGKKIGELALKYTNPPNDPEIARITSKHRPRIFGAIGAVTALFGLLIYFVILPIRNVTAAMSPLGGGPPNLLLRPRTQTETVYNRIAQDALLTRVDETIRSLPDERPGQERFMVEHRICRTLAELFGYGPVWIVSRASDDGRFALRGAFPDNSQETYELGASLLANVSDRIEALASATNAKEPAALRLKDAAGRPMTALAASLTASEPDAPQSVLLAVPGARPDRVNPSALSRQVFERVAAQAQRSLAERRGRQKRMARERSEANINLARHLGHDLTNIIATSKLDLMAVRDFLNAEGAMREAAAPRQRIFLESLEALLKNTQFLQEIVNLYRSFSYIRHPRYEWVGLNPFVERMAELFSQSTSSKGRIETRLDPSSPRVRVEPRLLGLCLFNLLTNAMEAIRVKNSRIKESGGTEPRDDVIVVSAGLREDGKRFQISVRDNGTGICGPDGNLLPDDELHTIFYLGQTTKSEDGAEGLGLDWVRTIVEEFHQGRVIPRNLSGGGAEFILDIPVESGERAVASEKE